MARGRKPEDPQDRFKRYIQIQPTGCWDWTGAKKDGVGIFFYNKTCMKAFRAGYQIFKGVELAYHQRLESNCNCYNPEHYEIKEKYR